MELDGLSIRIPMTLHRRGGRKLVIVPDGLEASAPQPVFDPVLINALVRAHRWRRQIEGGEFRCASELATHEKITDSFVARMLCLTLLAPDITQAILEGRQPKGLKLATLLRGVPLDWEEQRNSYGIVDTATGGLSGSECVDHRADVDLSRQSALALDIASSGRGFSSPPIRNFALGPIDNRHPFATETHY